MLEGTAGCRACSFSMLEWSTSEVVLTCVQGLHAGGNHDHAELLYM